MTLEAVFKLAEAMSIAERWQMWQFCGEHDHATLPTAAQEARRHRGTAPTA